MQSFLFRTRLTNVTRALDNKDIDDRARTMFDPGRGLGGRDPHRHFAAGLQPLVGAARAAGQGAIVILFSDGLERGETAEMANLGAETERLQKSCRRLI